MKLRNAVLYVNDIDVSKDFYKSIGFKVVDDFGKFVTFETSDAGVTLAINLADIEDKVPGKQTVIFEVPDIDMQYEAIKSVEGINIYKELIEAPFGRTFSFLDTDGNKIEYVERKSNQHIQVNVSVIVILMKDDQVFLFKRKNTGWADGDYTVPSGHVDKDETPIGAAIREAKEEVGVTIKEADLKLVHSDFITGDVINFTFLANDWDGVIKVMEDDKAEDGEWFSLSNLPANIAGHGSTILENINKNVIYHEIK